MVEFRGEVVKGRGRTGQGHKIDAAANGLVVRGKGQTEFKNVFPSKIVKVSNGEE